MSDTLGPVSATMTSPVHTISVDTMLPDASTEMEELRLSSLAVVDGGRLAGVITYTDLLRAGTRDKTSSNSLVLPKKPVSEIMSVNLISVPSSAPLQTAAREMVERKIHRVYVLEGDTVVGVVSTRDLMYAVRDANIKRPALELMSSPVISALATDPLSSVSETLGSAGVSGVVITDERGWPIGMFSQREALQAADESSDTPIESVMSCSVLALPMTIAMHRAAAQAATTRVRRVVIVEVDSISGILTGLDFARAIAEHE